MDGASLPTIHIESSGWELKKLSQKHKNIIALHLQCVKRTDIADIVKCTPEYVSMILQQPLAKAYMQDVSRYIDSRLDAMYDTTVDVIEKGLKGDATDTQLKAARLQLEVTGRLKKDQVESQSAEDVVSAIMAAATKGVLAIGTNVQVNVGDTNGSSDEVLPASKA